MKGWTPRLVMRKRLRVIWKCPIEVVGLGYLTSKLGSGSVIHVTSYS